MATGWDEAIGWDAALGWNGEGVDSFASFGSGVGRRKRKQRHHLAAFDVESYIKTHIATREQETHPRTSSPESAQVRTWDPLSIPESVIKNKPSYALSIIGRESQEIIEERIREQQKIDDLSEDDLTAILMLGV